MSDLTVEVIATPAPVVEVVTASPLVVEVQPTPNAVVEVRGIYSTAQIQDFVSAVDVRANAAIAQHLANAPHINGVATLNGINGAVTITDNSGNPLTASGGAIALPPSGSNATYETTFNNGNLSIAGVLPVTHGLSTYPSGVVVWDGSGRAVDPDEVEFVSVSAIAINLSSFVPIVGTWRVSLTF